MRIFMPERVRNFMNSLGLEKGEAIEHRMVNNSIEKAQRRVEGQNFDAARTSSSTTTSPTISVTTSTSSATS